jgi:hypothetical protein
MRPLYAATLGALVAAGAFAVFASAGGGPPPPADPSAPQLGTVVAHGAATARVQKPAQRSDRTIERAVQTARRVAFPPAVANARLEALTLAKAAGLRLGGPIGIARDIAPPGWWDDTTGRFGPGRWCGRVTTRRAVRGTDGDLHYVRRSHHACPVPREQSARVTVTFAVR